MTAICSKHSERARKASLLHGIPKYSQDWRELVQDPEIDAIAIATVPQLQPSIAIEALRRGKAVLCEKPISVSLDQARQMVAAARQSRRPNMVDLEFPEIGAFKIAHDLLRQKAIGKLRHGAVSWSVETYASKMNLVSWKTDPRLGGGTLNNFVSHSFYYLERFFGGISDLSCRLFHSRDLKGAGDTLVTLTLRFCSGFIATVTVCTDAILGHGHRITFYGDRGTLLLDNPTEDYAGGFTLALAKRGEDGFKEIRPKGSRATLGEDGRIRAVSGIVERFVAWIQKGKRAGPDFADGYRVQWLIQCARDSDRKGCWVKTHG